jgi:predicted transposase/invertase (TIGR01784 family)
VAFPLFRCAEYYSEFRLLEVTRHEQLTDRMCMIYFELPKLPEIAGANGELMYWLLLFRAKTEEELTKIEKEGGAIMAQAIVAYRHISASEKFKELERMRVRRLQDEASALGNAERKGIQKGKKENSIAIAKKMKAKGFDIKDIIDMTDLTVDDILQL